MWQARRARSMRQTAVRASSMTLASGMRQRFHPVQPYSTGDCRLILSAPGAEMRRVSAARTHSAVLLW